MIRTLLALLLLCATTACGQRNAAHDAPPPSPALWEVTAPNGQRGWLFGTIHALPKDLQWRTRTLDGVLEQAGLLVVEVANLHDEGAGMAAFEQRAHSAGLPPVLQRVSPTARPALADAMERSGLDQDDLATTESWAAALTILNAGRAEVNGNGVDRALLRERLPVAGLESHAQLFGLFDALAADDQRVLLELAAEMRDPAEETLLVEQWRTGNVPAMERELGRGLLADPELREALLERRNAAWLPQVERFVRQGRRPLVAVGAAHLVGKSGLATQLQAGGFTVRRIQ